MREPEGITVGQFAKANAGSRVGSVIHHDVCKMGIALSADGTKVVFEADDFEREYDASEPLTKVVIELESIGDAWGSMLDVVFEPEET